MAALHSLFLKPSLQCTARCGHCESRRTFYRTRSGKTLSVDDYRRTIAEGRALGARSLHLSGGEPTLYSHLAELVNESRRAGMFTILNTNGSLINQDYARELLDAGLQCVIISIHSHLKHKHDSIRRRDGNFDEVVNALRVLGELRGASHREFIISTQTIVTKCNYADLPDIIDLVCSLGVDAHGLSYLEGDFGLENSLAVDDIKTVRNTVIPQMVGRLEKFRFTNVVLKHAAIRVVSRLYQGSPERWRDMSRGVYRKEGSAVNCRTPRGFAMVLADGSVLPCNMTEYTDGPVLGNVNDEGLSSIVRSDRWRDFAKNGYEYCRYCPTHLHFHIPLSISLRKIIPLAFVNPAFEQKSVPARVREGL